MLKSKPTWLLAFWFLAGGANGETHIVGPFNDKEVCQTIAKERLKTWIGYPGAFKPYVSACWEGTYTQ